MANTVLAHRVVQVRAPIQLGEHGLSDGIAVLFKPGSRQSTCVSESRLDAEREKNVVIQDKPHLPSRREMECNYIPHATVSCSDAAHTCAHEIRTSH